MEETVRRRAVVVAVGVRAIVIGTAVQIERSKLLCQGFELLAAKHPVRIWLVLTGKHWRSDRTDRRQLYLAQKALAPSMLKVKAIEG